MELWSAPYAVFGPEGVTPEGALLTDGRRVLALGPREALLKAHPSAQERRFSTYLGLEAANAHTHLDLGLGPVFKGPFMEFVLKAVFPRNEERGLKLAKEAAQAARQRVLGDIVAKDDGTLEWWLLEAPFQGVAYLEVLGLFPPEVEKEYLKKLKATVRRLKKLERPGGPRLGLSPHAPYSLTPSLLKAAVELALEEGLPLQIHAAESPAEAAYFKDRTGAIAEFYHEKGLPMDLHPVGLSPIQYLAELGVLNAKPLLIHGVQVSEEDVKTIAESGARLVSCPRSNLNLEAGLPPYPLYQKHNVPIALGTDSALSGGSLDVWDEVRLLLKAGVPAKEAFSWAVLEGTKALGLTPHRLQPGDPLASVVGW